jgi:hypothetical protein
MKNLKPLYFLLFLGVSLTIANIPLELPEELQGQFEASGRIDSCEIANFSGNNTRKFSVGIKLDDKSIPVLRINPIHAERTIFEEICRTRVGIRVKYHAKKRVYGPITYWIDPPIEFTTPYFSGVDLKRYYFKGTIKRELA